jgi:hypothetical protein
MLRILKNTSVRKNDFLSNWLVLLTVNALKNTFPYIIFLMGRDVLSMNNIFVSQDFPACPFLKLMEGTKRNQMFIKSYLGTNYQHHEKFLEKK